jgi:hypothetical protein
MQQLSPKKYIETKARSLPIYKCLVNLDWKISKMAHVIVMRKHVTGNLTLGYFLIDLMCLGVKDTFYNFNTAESLINEKFESFEQEEIDYTLAHNIIYAGHDFAKEFDIPPHKDFAITKFILEEDDEKVPIIEISSGDMDGKPHLMINPRGEGKWALPLLIKNAGAGNYYYSDDKVGFDHDFENGNYGGEDEKNMN